MAQLSSSTIFGVLNVTAGINTQDLTVNGQLAITVTNLPTSGTVILDFTTGSYKTQGSLTGDITYNGINYGVGRNMTIRVLNGGTQRNLSFPSDWRFVGSKPTNIPANKVGLLNIICFGTTADSCVASWMVES